MSNELPPPTGYATHNGMRSLQQDDATVLLYPHDYLIRPDQVPLYTADQMHEYGRACERAAYERAAQRVPLSDEQIRALVRPMNWPPSVTEIVRGVEQAHGIRSEK